MPARSFTAFCRDESGATAIEYGLIAALIVLAIITSFTIMGNELARLFNNGAAEVINNQTARL